MWPPVGGGAHHVVRGHPGLLDRVAPVFEREKLLTVEWVREARDVPRHEQVVGDDEVRVDRAAPRVAGDAHPTRREPGLIEPLGVAEGPEGDHGDLGLDGAAVRETSAAQPLLRVALERLDLDAAPQIDAVRALQVRDSQCDGPAERSDEGCGRSLHDRDRETALAAHGGDLGPVEPGADDQHPVRSSAEPLVEALGVVAGSQGEDAVELSLLRVAPGPGARPGRDEQTVELERPPIREADLVAGEVQLRRGNAQPPLDVGQRSDARQRRVIGRDLPRQHGLRQRRPVVRQVRLIPHDGQPSGEPLGSQTLGSTQSSQGGAHDDDAGPPAAESSTTHGDPAGGGPPSPLPSSSAPDHSTTMA